MVYCDHSTGVVLGILTGIRGLCNGLGPALYGLLFYIFDVQLYDSGDFTSATPTTGAPPINSTLAADVNRTGVCMN